MRTRRLLGATLTTALAVGMLGAAMPTAAAGDNDKADWDDKRVVQTPGHTDGAVHVLANRGAMTTVVRELGAGTDTWRLRENRDRGLTFRSPVGKPRDVQRFRYDESQLLDSTYVAYEHDGRLWAAEAAPQYSSSLSLTGDQETVGSPGGLAAAGTEAPKVVAGESNKDHAIITQDGTWHQHFGPVGGANPATTPNDVQENSRWESYPDPNLDGVPGNAGEDYAFANDGDALVVFWNAPGGDLRYATRSAGDTTAAWSAPQTLATGGEQYVDYVETNAGGRLITQAADGAVTLWVQDFTTGVTFGQARQLAGPVTSGDPITEPTATVDTTHATLTVGWREPDVADGGLVLWQEDRPVGSFLETPALVPGTRRADARFVASPKGSLSVAIRRNSETDIVRVKHLPAGKRKWTNGRRLVSPKPQGVATAWAIGSPNNRQQFRVAVNDRVGVYGFRFNAPRPTTKVTKPVRKVQRTKTYRIGWNTSWAFANDWQVRMRLDKRRGGYGPWKVVNVDEGDRSKTVTRARGKTWCYEARGYFGESRVSKWSEQRCVTVRR